MQFKDILIGKTFIYNGNKYRKVSSKTALLEEFNRVFYFKLKDLVVSL